MKRRQEFTWQLNVSREDALTRLRDYLTTCPDSALAGDVSGTDIVLRRRLTSLAGWYSFETSYVAGTVSGENDSAVLRWRSCILRGRAAFLVVHLAFAATILAVVLVSLGRYGPVSIVTALAIAVSMGLGGWRAVGRIAHPDPLLVSHLRAALTGIVVAFG